MKKFFFFSFQIVTIVSSKFLTCVHVVSALRVIHSWVDPHERRNIPIDILYPFYWAIPRKKKKGMHCFSCLKSSKEAKEPKQSWKCWKGSSSKKEEDDDERTRKRKGRGICCFLRGKSCKGEEPLKKKGNKCRRCFFCFKSSKDEPFRKRRRRCTGGACCHGSTKNKAVPEKEGKQGGMCCCFSCVKPSSEVPLEKRRKNGCCYKPSSLLVPKEEGKNMMSSNIHSSAVKNRMSSSLHSFEVVLKEGGKNRMSSNIHSSQVLPKDEVKNRMSSSLHSSEVVPKDQVKNRMSSSLHSSEVVPKDQVKNRMSTKIHSSELLPKDEGKSRISFSLHSSQVLPKERKVRINSNLYSSEVLPKQEGKSKMNHDIHSSEAPSRKRRQCAKCCFPCSKDSSSKESSRKKGIGMCCFSCNKNSSKESSRKKDKCGMRCLFCNKESSVESSRKKEKCGMCWFCCGKSFNKEELRREKGEATNYFNHDKSTEKKCCVPCFKSSKTDQPVKRRERPTSKSPKGKSLKWRIRKIFFCLRCCSKKKRKINNKSSRKKVICWKRKEKKNTNHLKSLTNNISFKSESGKFRSAAEEILRIGNGISNAQEFTYAELAAATQNFKPENQLAVGGFGRIYKGELKDTKQVIAVKQLNRFGNQGNREFLTEVLMLSLLDHPNLIHLLGYCAYGDEKLIVYEYMPLGSLQDHLFGLSPPNSKPLDWFTRMKIGAGVAKGLQFMHEVANPPVIHRDLKPSNILLDEEFNPKLSDFGISKLGPVGDQRHVSTRVMGTCGYYAPEYALTGQLTKMSDIYSLGIVLLELITGRKAIDPLRPNSERMLVDWALPLFHDKQRLIQLADPSLDYNFPVRALYQAVAVAIMCIEDEDTKRPRIKDIVSALDYLTSPHEHAPQEPEDPESLEECVPQDSQDPVVDPYIGSISEGSSHLSSSPVTDDPYMRSISEVSSHLAFRPVVDPYKRSISEDSSRFASNDWQSCSTIRDDESDMITIEL